MNRLPYIVHSLAAASASARALARVARPSCTTGSGFSHSFSSSAFLHGLRPFPFGFTPIHRSSAISGHALESVDPARPHTPAQVQQWAPELVDEIQLASALDAAGAVAASEAMSAANPKYFDLPTAALDSAVAAEPVDSDLATAPNLSWFVDPAATDMLPLWQRNLLASAADTAIAERSASTATPAALSLEGLLHFSDGKLTPRILSEFLTQHGGHDVVVLDTAARSDVTDSMVLATASSTAHMVSLASRLHAFIKEQITAQVASQEEREAAMAAISVEGMDCDDWILLDLGKLFVHIMTKEGRCEYDLDGLWGGKSMAKKDDDLAVGHWEQAGELASRWMPPGPVAFDDENQRIQLRL